MIKIENRLNSKTKLKLINDKNYLCVNALNSDRNVYFNEFMLRVCFSGYENLKLFCLIRKRSENREREKREGERESEREVNITCIVY
jgi:hypothetical protein